MSREQERETRKVWLLAKAITPEQLAELLSVKTTMTTLPTGCLTFARNRRKGSDAHWLMARGLMALTKPSAFGVGADAGDLTVTTRGERVMLCRVGWDLTKAGAIPDYDAEREAA